MNNFPSSLSLVFPLFNEEKRFLKGLSVVLKYYKDYPDWEFIFVNDGSTDKTKTLVEDSIQKYPRCRLVSYKTNQGKGYALKKGILSATKKYVLFSDIDFSTPMTELELFYPFLKKGADVVIGTRKVKGATIEKHQGVLREWLGKRFTNLSNAILDLDLSDYTCGFKIFTRESARKLFKASVIKRWGFDAEILYLAHRLGFKIVEVPVCWKNDERSKVSLAKDVFRSLSDLIQIRITDVQGRYRL